MGKVDPKVDEAIETLNMKDGADASAPAGRDRSGQRDGGGVGVLLAACSRSSPAAAGGTSAIGDFPKTPAWQFWFVNHVTTNLFFVPTQSGFTDAATLLGLPSAQVGRLDERSSCDADGFLHRDRHLRPRPTASRPS